MAERRPNTTRKDMEFSLRRMTKEDASQVSAIECNAFSELRPPTSFEREAASQITGYLVAWRPAASDAPNTSSGRRPPSLSVWQRLFERARRQQPPTARDDSQQIVGYVGTWFMTDEAHIVAVAVLESWRRSGIGELLLIGALELALARGSRVATLEVRISNAGAQTLYRKYGFNTVGSRKRYYADNGEDAFIMTTDSIRTPEYQARFQTLVRAHEERRGHSTRLLAP
ncbi:MAG: ribosomal-protein-alanine N-acetyltransferase [Dehalococcoidia bacterium]|nr:ribosomal-protein-alanine N-acetyltransferase [Dehalococcoidia bacterium]